MGNILLGKRGKSLALIINLVLAVVAFSFIVGLSEAEIVSGWDIGDTTEIIAEGGYGEKTIWTLDKDRMWSNPNYPTKYGHIGNIEIAPPGPIELGGATSIQNPTAGGVLELSQKTQEELARERVAAGAEAPAAGAAGATGAAAPKTAGWGSAAWSGLKWAAVAYGAGQLLGPILGFEEEQTKALSLALAAGAGIGKFLSAKFGASGWYGVAIAAAVFLATYKEEEIKTVTFNCLPWQAPVGGNDCEICNDPDLPCSEYRCRSLGQSCELVNKGTDEEKCAYINPNDVDFPIISPNENLLSPEYEYTDVKISPPGPGFKIVRKEGTGDEECVKAFTPLQFGIDTNEPAQCKIDLKQTEKFDEMTYWFGGTNLFAYNHTEHFSLPGPEAFANSSLVLENGKDFTFFIRCRDKNGNENSAEYAVRFCVDPSPDTTAPQIKETSIENNGCIAAGTNNLNVEFYVNEPADCRWSKENKYYELMENSMDCSSQVYEINALMLYTCKANLTGVSRDETTFYIRCKDQPIKPEDDPDRNKNKESYIFKLRGSNALKMKNLEPTEKIYGAVDPAPVTLSVQTLFGCDAGKAVCFYSTTGQDSDYVMFYDTNTDDGIHTQRQDLGDGEHTYYYKCVDSGGNIAINSTTFELDIDVTAPVIARVYEEDEMLKIVTVRDSECSYSLDNCDFLFEEGTEMPYPNSTAHVAEWKKDRTYYIKCRDEFRNEEADCSVIVKPTDLLL